MIYIEPTPYIAALIEALRGAWDGPIEVLYVTTDLSQPWHLRIDREQSQVLPAGFAARLKALWTALSRNRKRGRQRGLRQKTVLHLAGWGHPALAVAMLMGKLLRIPVVVESDTGTERATSFWLRTLKKLVYPLLFRLPRRFLPGGTRQARYLARFGVKPERMTIAQMTVDVGAIRSFCSRDRAAIRAAARARWGMSAAEQIVLYIGRLEDYKGIELLLSAFGRAAAAGKDLRLAIAGDGSLRRRVEAVAADADRHVAYLGRLSGDDVLRAYLAADVVVLTSLFEPWGLVVNEAMACGLPVIVSDQVGCADDLVRHRETGLVVGAGCEQELTAAILELADDAPVRRRMGEAAEKLIAEWTLGNEAQNIISAWSGIAG